MGKIIVSIEDLSEEDSILDEISDYLDSDIVNDADSVEPQKDTKKKRKQAV